MPDRLEPTLSVGKPKDSPAEEPYIGAARQGNEGIVSAPAPTKPSRRAASWWLIAITFIVYLVVIALRTLGRTEGDVPYRFGETIVAVSLNAGLAILFFSIWQRFRNSRSRYRIALAVGIWLFVGAGGQFRQEGRDYTVQRRVAAAVGQFHQGGTDYAAQRRVVEADMREALALAQTRSKALRANQKLPAYMPQLNATGFWGDAERVWMTVFSQALTLSERFDTELAVQGFYKVLAPGWATAGPSLAESKRILKQAQATVTRYDALFQDLIDRLPAQIEALPLKTATGEQKEAMLRGFREKLPDGRAGMHEVWKAEAVIIDELAAMIDVLDHSRGRWREDDGKLIFARAEDRAAYEAHWRAASDQDARVTQLRAASLAPVFAMLGS